MVQIVNEPTRNDITLDNIVTNLTEHYNPVEIISPLELSDHQCVIERPRSSLLCQNVVHKRFTYERK